jgi:hypothetical protein
MNNRRTLLMAAMLIVCTAAVGCRRQSDSKQQRALESTPVQVNPSEAASASREGHRLTVRCLRGERAMTDGDELRCEAWTYVQDNYAAAP